MDKKIEEWSESLTKRLTEIRLVDVEEMKLSIKTHIKAALYDCLKSQISDTERKLNQLKIRQAGGGNTMPLQAEIISTKQKLKEENELYSKLERENMAREMTIWMRKHHNDSIIEFYKMYNEKFPKINKS